jgi:hypothetical protein
MSETEIIHEVPFSINAENITKIARDIYWFQHRENNALKLLSNFEGLPLDTAYEILMGNAKLVSTGEGGEVKVIFEKDIEFQKLLAEHIEILKEQKKRIEWHQKQWKKNRRGNEEEMDTYDDGVEHEIQRRTLIFINSFIERCGVVAYLGDAIGTKQRDEGEEPYMEMEKR